MDELVKLWATFCPKDGKFPCRRMNQKFANGMEMRKREKNILIFYYFSLKGLEGLLESVSEVVTPYIKREENKVTQQFNRILFTSPRIC